MARVGINQLRGTAWNMHNYLKDFKNKLPEGANIQPISCVAEPTIHAAETCFHLLDILASVNHTVGQIRTDLALQTNYFGAHRSSEFIFYQRIQHRFLLNRYLKPVENGGTEPVVQIYIISAEGAFLMAFLNELINQKLIQTPVPRWVEISNKEMNHANFFAIEAIGANEMKVSDLFTLLPANTISDHYKIPTDKGIHFPGDEMRRWMLNPTGACAREYFEQRKSYLSDLVSRESSRYQTVLTGLLREEWSPYLASMFIYSCRAHLTVKFGPAVCDPRTDVNPMGEPVAAAACASGGADGSGVARSGPGGDCL